MIFDAEVKLIETSIGNIAVYFSGKRSENTPLILLHGVYFDHHLWDYQVERIIDRSVITLDMPWHGASHSIKNSDWTLNDCVEMLVEILDNLKIQKVIAVGHSWGSMTILRAAIKYPARFESIGLCNMPFHAVSAKQKSIFRLQHTLLVFRNFYMRQAAKTLFGNKSLAENADLVNQLKRPMRKLNNKQIRKTDKAVIFDAEDATSMILNLPITAIALKGKEDYVPIPPRIETILVEGGHISPIEQPGKVLQLIQSLLLHKTVLAF
jgi:3-oxoadipate enol-lactonase